jgi:uncharacterized protein (DUF58 family)
MSPEAVHRSPSVKLRTYLALAALGTVAGLVLGRPELVARVAPMAVYVALGLVRGIAPSVTISTGRVGRRVLEGETVTVELEVSAAAETEQLELELKPDPGLTLPTTAARVALRLAAGERRTVRFELHAERWGAPPAGALRAVAHDRYGLIDYRLAERRLPRVRVYPTVTTLRRIVDPHELQATSGSRVARQRGDGIEFAEVRPFAAGDVVRRINWRVTARRGSLYVSERHPERNADVILFLDTWADVGGEQGSTLESAVRAAASLATAYLERKDRVGVIGFGGILRGLGPRLGTAQLYRIVDALIESQVTLSYVDKDVRLVPRRLLPPKALVVAITPLIDERATVALFDLRRRGFELAILDVSPVPFTPPGSSPSDALGHRLWLLHRHAVRAQFERLGVPVSEWLQGEPLQLPVARAAAFRRRTRQPVAR